MTEKPASQALQCFTLLREYAQKVDLTDTLPSGDPSPVLLGLYGEVGSVMAIAKKRHREPEIYVEYENAVEEELGDVLWYFAALCRRFGQEFDLVFSKVINEEGREDIIAAGDLITGRVSRVSATRDLPAFDDILFGLGETATALLRAESGSEHAHKLLHTFASEYLQAVQATQVPFFNVVRTNMEKACGRFLDPIPEDLPVFDDSFPDEERLPEHFEIKVTQRKSGKSYLQWNNVFIGDPLTDSIRDPDGYRFHDVFHLAYAAILHWSPIFRGLIKQKRKSDPQYDDAEDGGRAKVVEEGLTAWVFSYAKNLNFFERQTSLPFDLLKTVHRFVHGYEVEVCPLKLWEKAILEGYKVFRQVRKYNGGIVVGDRDQRTITYKRIEGEIRES
ncbi:MAG: nucleoside triphosphate pyrophosphohydrolase family protein [Gammaproteobacteria bacterium]|nr:nucleoside triphosphate pyrophosphohydrolase family protein [Gammaproteobacteria bacterium]